MNLRLTKLLLYLTIVLQRELDLEGTVQRRWIRFCQVDLATYPEHLQGLRKNFSCEEWISNFNFSKESFVDTVNSLLGTRDLQYAHLAEVKVVLKRVFSEDVLKQFEAKVSKKNLSSTEVEDPVNQDSLTEIKAMEGLFHDRERAGGSIVCGRDSRQAVQRFFAFLNSFSLRHFVLLLNLNIQPLLLTFLEDSKLPTPTQFYLTGFTSVTSYEGQPISKYLNSNFKTRLKIAQLLMKAVLKMTKGHQGFRIYMTDMTGDNVVVSDDLTKVAFVDLDNVILVDSSSFDRCDDAVFNSSRKNDYSFDRCENEDGSDFGKEKISCEIDGKDQHVHETIECIGCFAYSPDDICSHYVSDVNIFSTCHFLSRDLYEDEDKGFLHQEPDTLNEESLNLREVLNECVECDQVDTKSCDRFQSAIKLIQVIEAMLATFLRK